MNSKALWPSEELLLPIWVPRDGQRELGTHALAGSQGEQMQSEPRGIESCTPASESW